MPVPKKKTSRSRRDKRRTHDKLVPVRWVLCKNVDCGQAIRSHCICPHCGYYGGRKILDIKKAKA